MAGKYKICSRCGKKLYRWHWCNGLMVCCDDRTCWPKQVTRRIKRLYKNKIRYGGGTDE